MAKVASGQPMRSAERLLQVLKCFGEGADGLSIADVSRRLDLAPSTVRRLLLTLEKEGFVRQDTAGGRYRLHYELVRLAAAALTGTSMVKAAGPILDELRDRLDEAVQLTVRYGTELIVVDYRPSGHLVKTFHTIGHVYKPFKGSAAGKAMLAWLPDDEIAALVPRSGRWDAYTERGIADLDSLHVALDATRERGYGLNEGETEPGVWSVAAPVRDHTGAVVAVLNIPCPESRLSDDRRSKIIGALLEAADILSAAVPFAA